MNLDKIYNICREFSDYVEVDENQDVLALINEKYLEEIKSRVNNFYWELEVRKNIHCFFLIKIYPLI